MRAALPIAAAAGALAVLVALVLQVAGGPLSTNDLWWHLRMGEAYAAEGPWLDADPSLHTARAAPPEPVAWLFAIGVHGVERGLSFGGLRALHLLAAAAIVALTWSIFRRERAETATTCLATGVFVVLAWPRLMQLRPDLVSILATLLLYRLLLEPREPPGWPRVAAAAALLLVWANAHTLFMLGPCLLVAALLGHAAGAVLRRVFPSARDAGAASAPPGRSRRVAVALGLGLLAALLNPRGLRQHLAFVTSAGEGAIQMVRDDWMPFHPLHWDRYGLGAGWLEWLVADAVLLLFLAAAAVGVWRFLRRPAPDTLRAIDPVLVGLALAAVVAAGSAVRFLWLAVFPLLFLLRFHAALVATRPGAALPLAWLAAAASVALAVALPSSSGYAAVSASLPRTLSRYLSTPYAASKFHEQGVRFLEETGVEGKLYNDYGRGGFLGYRLAPRLRTFLDSSMNVGDDVFADYRSVNAQRGGRPGESFLDVLERREVDLFFGVGAPSAGPDDERPYTAAHLERAPGWLLVSRGPRYAIYLRAHPRNAANLDRIARWYARAGIPFDPEGGLDVSELVRHHGDWAVARGMLPAQTPALELDRASPDPARRYRGLDALARAYLLIGAYPLQIEADREAAALRPRAVAPRRRLVVGLLRQGRAEEAVAAARELRRVAPQDPYAEVFVRVAEEYARGAKGNAPINGLPLFAPTGTRPRR